MTRRNNAPAAEIVERMTAVDGSVQILIVRNNDGLGYHVVVQDIDTGECLPTVRLVPSLEWARALARDMAASPASRPTRSLININLI